MGNTFQVTKWLYQPIFKKLLNIRQKGTTWKERKTKYWKPLTSKESHILFCQIKKFIFSPVHGLHNTLPLCYLVHIYIHPV